MSLNEDARTLDGMKPARAGAGAKKDPAKTDTAKTAAPTRPREGGGSRFAQTFAQVVGVLMRDPRFKRMKIADLEWLVIPPLMTGQIRLAHAAMQKRNELFVPVAMALWARVSPAVDKRLSENLDKPMRLRLDEWTSGDIPWLIAVAGDPRAIPIFLKQLDQAEEFKGKKIKIRTQTDGGPVVKLLSEIVRPARAGARPNP